MTPLDEIAAARLKAMEVCRKLLQDKADAYAHEHFSHDPSTGVWETRSAAAEAYDEGLRDAVEAIAKLACDEFGHAWMVWNEITRRCRRCEMQEHGEHLRDSIADLARDGLLATLMVGRPQVRVLVEAIARIYGAKVYEGGEMKNGISVEMIAAISDAARAANLHPEIERLDRAAAKGQQP